MLKSTVALFARLKEIVLSAPLSWLSKSPKRLGSSRSHRQFSLESSRLVLTDTHPQETIFIPKPQAKEAQVFTIAAPVAPNKDDWRDVLFTDEASVQFHGSTGKKVASRSGADETRRLTLSAPCRPISRTANLSLYGAPSLPGG